MKKILLPLLMLFTTISYGQQSFSWTKVSDYPYAAWGMASCNHNGTLYTFSNCGTSNNTLYKYTETTDKWDTLAKLSGTTVCNTAMAGIGGKIYLLGSGSMQAYDIATDSWSSVVSLPAAVKKDGASMIVIGTDIYIIGGGTSTTDNFFKFNTGTKTFTTMAPMKTPRENAQVALQGNKIYAIAGRRSGTALNAGEVYDIATDTWTDLIPAFEKRYFGFAVADKQYIYIMGGETGTNSFKYKTIELFDPVNNTVTILAAANNMNVEHTAYALGISGTKLVAAAGFTNTPANQITNYCESTDFNEAVSIMAAQKANIDFTAYPNPANSFVTVKAGSNAEIASIYIYNNVGQLFAMVNNRGNKQQLTISISGLPTGNYIIKAVSPEGHSQQRTLSIVQ